eukprot:TRINITY_DN99061_c0_g1_i1.p1 TRINITY_DN99061_c0_g1~~TRINITY_DN99061_c0_g1_i1.p1  ORF type:complete len:376 (-),score=44.96 TRINITY_DN99061_c0_g1_i1:224-1351(-)
MLQCSPVTLCGSTGRSKRSRKSMEKPCDHPLSGPEDLETEHAEGYPQYIFLVRHAESVWNKMLHGHLRSAPILLQKRDHKLSQTGIQQASSLHERILATQRFLTQEPTANNGIKTKHDEVDHFHQAFCGFRVNSTEDSNEQNSSSRAAISVSVPVLYSSPLLRALQTSHHVLPMDDHWGKIFLLRNAREWLHVKLPLPGLHVPIERDCLSVKGNVGGQIAERALREDSQLQRIPQRVDPGDCTEQWWSSKVETREDLKARVSQLWRQLGETKATSCILFTHSNVIRALSSVLAEQRSQSKAATSDVCQELLEKASVRKLQNAGVLGLQCSLQGGHGAGANLIVEHASLMFGTDFEPPKKKTMFSCFTGSSAKSPK